MAFRTMEIDAPQELRTGDFLLRPIRVSDAELDHDAVMESKEFLRKWEQSTWPTDDFTVEANREDLANLEGRHSTRDAFTYTVMNLNQTECLGCVYLIAPDHSMYAGAHVSPLTSDEWSTCDATIFFWVRKSRLAQGLDRALLDALVSWLDQEWPFNFPVIVTNEQFEQQVSMLDGTDLRRVFTIKVPSDSGAYLAYA
jgi:hypothetical protein